MWRRMYVWSTAHRLHENSEVKTSQGASTQERRLTQRRPVRKRSLQKENEKQQQPSLPTESISYVCVSWKFPFSLALYHWPFQQCSFLEYTSININLLNAKNSRASFFWVILHALEAKVTGRQTCPWGKISSQVRDFNTLPHKINVILLWDTVFFHKLFFKLCDFSIQIKFRHLSKINFMKANKRKKTLKCNFKYFNMIKFINRKFFSLLYFYCSTCMPGAWGGQKKALGTLEPQLQMVMSCTRVLKIRPESSVRTASQCALNSLNYTVLQEILPD